MVELRSSRVCRRSCGLFEGLPPVCVRLDKPTPGNYQRPRTIPKESARKYPCLFFSRSYGFFEGLLPGRGRLEAPETKKSGRPNQLQSISPQMPLLHFFPQLGFSDHAIFQATLHQPEEELFLVGVRVSVVGAGELVLAKQGAAGKS